MVTTAVWCRSLCGGGTLSCLRCHALCGRCCMELHLLLMEPSHLLPCSCSEHPCACTLPISNFGLTCLQPSITESCAVPGVAPTGSRAWEAVLGWVSREMVGVWGRRSMHAQTDRQAAVAANGSNGGTEEWGRSNQEATNQMKQPATVQPATPCANPQQQRGRGCKEM